MPPPHNSANGAIPLHSRLQTSYPSTHFVTSLCTSTLLCFWLLFHTSSSLSLSDALSVLQWNLGGLRSRNAELLHFISLQRVDFICIQESNLNSSSVQNPVYSAIWLHSLRSDILFPDHSHPSSGVLIFVTQGLSFEVFTLSLCLIPTLTK